MYLLQEGTVRNLKWIDGSPLSFQKWQNPRPGFVQFFKASQNTGKSIKYDSYILNREQLPQPMTPAAYNVSLCTGFMIYSSLNLEWVTLPCDQNFSNVLVICEGPYMAQKHDLLQHGRILPRQYVECIQNLTMIGSLCYRMFNIPRKKNVSCFDFVAKCQTEMSALASIPANLNGKVEDQRSMNYFSSWVCMKNDVLHGIVPAGDGNTCSVWQIRMTVFFLSPYVLDHQSHVHGSFICNREPVLVKFSCQLNQFQCADGTCILSHYACDGSTDYPDATDELDCTNICKASLNLTNSPMVLYCYESCFPGECICHDLYYQCGCGGCIPQESNFHSSIRPLEN